MKYILNRPFIYGATVTVLVLLLYSASVHEEHATSSLNGVLGHSAVISLDEGMSRREISERIGAAKEYDGATIAQLEGTYKSLQWDTFKNALVEYLAQKYSLRDAEKEVLLTHAPLYLSRDGDVLETLYVPKTYVLESTDTVLMVAEKLIEPLKDTIAAELPHRIDSKREQDLLMYVYNETELLPDLIPLPPQDVEVRPAGNRTLLVFTTIYYNAGKGKLELRADPTTINTPGDFHRIVNQRIYRRDGTYREREAGTFEWHAEHLHYHFQDFVDYELLHINQSTSTNIVSQKSTFCVRDVSRITTGEFATTSAATYQVCGRERQGVSVGWGDAYFSTYADQNLDITHLESGTYELSFYANPENRFDEVTRDNNRSSAIIRYDRDAKTVDVLETRPATVPDFEHIHVEQNM